MNYWLHEMKSISHMSVTICSKDLGAMIIARNYIRTLITRTTSSRKISPNMHMKRKTWE